MEDLWEQSEDEGCADRDGDSVRRSKDGARGQCLRLWPDEDKMDKD
jgi:hypothetical protein